MNKIKSLSDSSTSESEEDYGKRTRQKIFQPRTKESSADDTEDENLGSPHKSAQSKFNSYQYPNLRHSTDDTEDEFVEVNESSPPEFKSGFKYPQRYVESGLISDDNESKGNIQNSQFRKRKLSADDTDDEHPEISQPPAKNLKTGKPLNSFGKTFPEREFSSKKSTQPTVLKVGASMPSGSINGIAMRMMKKMGYEDGTGLGKDSRGRVDIIEASKQKGHRGLGHKPEAIIPSNRDWNFSSEDISLTEAVAWIPKSDLPPLTFEQLQDWIKTGEKLETIRKETEFCDPVVLQDVLAYKSVFNEMSAEEMRTARTRSNPFESIRGGMFLNRAAMKMANIDAILDFMFTDPKNKNMEPMVGKKDLLYFADVCAGPGGFSEYVLWRKQWESKGFGFTLKGENDFKLDDFFAGPPETFQPNYGIKDDGNIFIPDNLESFQAFVLANTNNKGVHFMMADGGFSVDGAENLQEVLSKRLYLCQFLCALMILRPEGHFVCKLFDVFTRFSVGLIYLMYNAFEQVSIIKPVTSRPANSERYIVCKWRKEDVTTIRDYMFDINSDMHKIKNKSYEDILEVVPLSILKGNQVFFNYIVNSNNTLGENQIIHLNRIKQFKEKPERHDDRQGEIRKACLQLWKVPDQVRSSPRIPDPAVKFKDIMKGTTLSNVKEAPNILTEQQLKKLEYLHDYHCIVNGDTPKEPAGLFLGLGKSNTFHHDAENSKWIKIDHKILLPADTLIYGELVYELKGEGKGQKKILCLHIVDAICLGKIDVRTEHYEERMRMAEKLARAVSKPDNYGIVPIKVKKIFPLPEIDQIFKNLAMKLTKSNNLKRLSFSLEDSLHIFPTGLTIIKTTSEPWITAYSKTHKMHYFFNTKTQAKTYERQPAIMADFKTCLRQRLFWPWNYAKLIDDQYIPTGQETLSGNTVRQFVKHYVHKMTGQPS